MFFAWFVNAFQTFVNRCKVQWYSMWIDETSFLSWKEEGPLDAFAGIMC